MNGLTAAETNSVLQGRVPPGVTTAASSELSSRVPGKELSLHAKLASIMGSIERVAKDGRNDFHKYDYVTEAALMDAVRSKLAENKVMLFTSIDGVTKDGTLTTILTTFTFVDGESGEHFEIKGAGTGDDKGDKGLYKAITGAVKYMLMKNFLISTGEDPENDEKQSRPNRGNFPPTSRRPQERVNASTGEVTENPFMDSVRRVEKERAELISELQQRRMFAIEQQNKDSMDAVKAKLLELGFKSSKDIPKTP